MTVYHTPPPSSPASSTQIELKIDIQASKQRVWQAIVEEIGLWWRKDFYVYENAKLVLEAYPGSIFNRSRMALRVGSENAFQVRFLLLLIMLLYSNIINIELQPFFETKWLTIILVNY